MSVSKTTRALVFERDGHRCVQCGSTLFLTLDHIVPVARGGNDQAANLQTLCPPCNFAKGDDCREEDKTPERMRPPRSRRLSPRRLGLRHHPACDEHYCFCECPVYLADHPQFAAALRANST